MYLHQTILVNDCPCSTITPIGDHVLVKIIPVKTSDTIHTPYEDKRNELKPAYGQIVTSQHPELPKGDYCIIDQYATLYHIYHKQEHYVLTSKYDILAISPTPINISPEYLRYQLK